MGIDCVLRGVFVCGRGVRCGWVIGGVCGVVVE